MSDLRFPDSPAPSLSTSTPRSMGSLGAVGPLALGCWRLTGEHVNNVRLVETALDLGMNLIDNADVYGLDWGGTHFGACEEELGRILREQPGLRDRMILATKGGIIPGVPYDSSSAYLVAACEASLTRLGVDHVDLYQIHRPDMLTHPQEVADALMSLRQRGLVRECGISNFSVSQTRALQSFMGDALVSTQPEFSAAYLVPMRDGTFDLCMETSLMPLAWSPLAGGRLVTGADMPRDLITTLDRLASTKSCSRAALALAFVLAHPSRPVAIVGTQSPERLADLATATHVTLSRAEMYSIIEASEGQKLP
jgi:predicted oxidoreductase